MKVIYLHQYFRTPDESGGTRSYEIARRLVSWGHEVHVVTSLSDPSVDDDWRSTIVDGIHVHRYPVPYNNKMGYNARLNAFFKFSLAASKRAAELNGDVVFATSTPLTIAIPGLFASIMRSCPLVFEVRDLWPEVPIAMGVLRNKFIIALARFLEWVTYVRSVHIIALSKGMEDGIASRGVRRTKITVIPNSSDLELFDTTRVASGLFRAAHPELPVGPIVLYPGTIGHVNGVTYIAMLAKQVLSIRPDISFVVVGDGAERDLVVEWAKHNKVFGVNFFVYPPVPKKELVHIFKDSDMVISTIIDIPALENNSANKIFDAMAAGRAIAINHGGWQEAMILESEIGVVLNRDIGESATKLVSFLENKERVALCGLNARALAETSFSRDVLAKKFESVLLDAFLGKSK